MYELLIFDADNTLFDFDKSEENAISMIFKDLKIPFKKEHVLLYRNINKTIWGEFEKGRIHPDQIKIRRFEILTQKLGIKADLKK